MYSVLYLREEHKVPGTYVSLGNTWLHGSNYSGWMAGNFRIKSWILGTF